jgi:hypothetical protein
MEISARIEKSGHHMTEFDFTAEITLAKSELETMQTELPALRAGYQTKEAAARDARERFNSFCARYNAVTRGGAASLALERMLDTERRARDDANIAATRAKRALETAEWRASCAQTDLFQLNRAENPPPLELPIG